MAARVTLALLLLAIQSCTSGAARVVAGEGSLTVAGKIDKETALKIPKIINSVGNLGITLVTAFQEDPPDVEYALENLEVQGWQLVKLLVPGEKVPEKAHESWQHAFDDLPELVDEIKNAWKTKDPHAGLTVMLKTMNKGLTAAALVVDPQAKRTISAANELIQSLGLSTTKFMKAMGFGEEISSLMQVDEGLPGLPDGWDASKINRLLTTGVGLITTFVAASTEDPPDFKYAIDSFKVQGWKIVKMTSTKKEMKTPKMKKAKKAWNQVFSNAAELAEKAYAAYQEGDTYQTVEVVVGTLEQGLRTAAHVNEEKAQALNALADLLTGYKQALEKYAQEVGWI